jgi:hypothetical protein
MLRRFAPALALCFALFAAPTLVRADDASDVRDTAQKFFKAMEAGNAADAKAMATGTDKQLALLDTLVPVVSAFKDLEKSAVKKWGEEGRKTLTQGQGGANAFNFEEEIKKAKVNVEGQSATIIPESQKPEDKKEPMKLKKVENKWKLDMGSIPSEGLDDPNATKMLKAMAEVAKSTATEIDQGKYQSAAAAKEAMGQKILPLILGAGAGGPGGPGATPPQPQAEPKK